MALSGNLFIPPPQNKARCRVAVQLPESQTEPDYCLWFALLSCEISAELQPCPCVIPGDALTYRAVEEPVGVHGQVLPRLGALDVHHPHTFCTQLQLNWEHK